MPPCTTEYRVIYSDCDPFDVVYYGRYLDFFERGRTELFRTLGLSYKEIFEGGIALPVTDTRCKYHKSARYDDLLLIESAVGYLKKASIRFEHRIYHKETDTLLAEGYTVHAFVDYDRKIVRVPDEVAVKIADFKESQGLS